MTQILLVASAGPVLAQPARGQLSSDIASSEKVLFMKSKRFASGIIQPMNWACP